jgi:hypothetical protein
MTFKEKQIPAFAGMTEYKYMDFRLHGNDTMYSKPPFFKGGLGVSGFKRIHGFLTAFRMTEYKYMDSSLRSE